jgi:hypothetical protein
MVDDRVVGRPLGGHRFRKLYTLFQWIEPGQTGDWVGPLGEKWRSMVGKVREWYVKSWHLQGISPRLSWLRTDGLAPASKYWTYRSHAGVYRPSKPSNLLSTEGAFTLTASMASCWWWRERLLYVDHVRYVWSWTIRGLSMESMWRVGQVFPSRVYNDLNRRDSQIWVTAYLW